MKPTTAWLVTVFLALVALTTTTLTTTNAFGAPPATTSNSAEAQTLFEEGKRLVGLGRLEEGCTRFEESQRISPAGGTVLHLAACREAQGRLATAWDLFHTALSEARRAGRKDREEVAVQRIASIEPRLARVRVIVPTLSRIAKLSVKRDNVDLDPATWGIAVPVDPGEHEITAQAPGHVTWASRVLAKTEGVTVDVTVPVLEESTAPTAPLAATSASKQGDTAGKTQPPAQEGLSPRRIGAIASVVVGLAATGVGTYFFFDAIEKKRAADDLCGGPAPTPCPAEGVAKADDAKTSGNIATVGIGVGVAALALGAVLWFLDPGPDRGVPSVSPSATARSTLRPAAKGASFALTF